MLHDTPYCSRLNRCKTRYQLLRKTYDHGHQLDTGRCVVVIPKEH